MDPLRVFVSSTTLDLADYRKAVKDRLDQMGVSVEVMENFLARPAEPSEVSVRAADECQVFVGIYGFRYGHTPVEGGPSITEMEYRRAREGGKRCLIYFADESLAAEARQRPGWEDEPEWKKERLKEFKAGIEKELVRAHGFKSDEELAGDIVEGLHLLITGYLPGYSHQDFLERWGKRSQEYADTFRGMQGLQQTLATPPLYRHWRTFVHRRPWHEIVRSKISEVCDAADNLDELSSFVNDFKDFNWERNYLNIQVELQKRVTHEHIAAVSGLIKRLKKQQGEDVDFNELNRLRDLRSDIWDSLRHAEEPNFRRCFLVRGSIGSGKSHFIMSVLGETLPLAAKGYPSRPVYPLVLLLEPTKITAGESIDQFILRALNEFSGLQWMSLEEFNRFVEKQDEDQVEKENIKLIVAIDDIQKWLSVRDKTGKGRDEIKSFIDRNTQLHSIHWLFTVKDTSYPDVALLADFWKRYSATSNARQRDGGRFHHDEEIDDVREIDGWIVLDDENRDDEIGIEIIRAEMLSRESDEETAVEDQALINMDLLTESAIRNLSNPFIAWILIELCRTAKLDMNNLVTLSYVSLITQFWQQRGAIFLDYFWNKLDPESKSRTGSLSDSDSIIRPVAQVLANQGEFTFRWNDLAKAVKTAATSDGVFDPERFATAALSAFVETNLLASYSAPDPAHPGDNATMLEIRFEPFWEYHLARRLLNADSIRSFDEDGARLDLDTWFGVVTDGEIKAGVLEFLFLLLDEALPGAEQPDKAGTARDFLKSLVGFGLKSETLPNRSVWFAGAKATEEFQRMVVGVTTTDLEDGLIRRELHAFMYFINAVLPEVLSPTERLRLLQPFYRQINEAGLSGYFRYIAMRLISRIEDQETLLWCMVYLDGCEVMGDASELSEATMAKLFDLARSAGGDSAQDEPEDTDLILDSITDVIIRYLQASTERGQHWREIPKNERQPPPYHYLAMVLREFCKRVVLRREFAAYEFLSKYSWYRPENINIHGPTRIDMSREANFALGSWYQHQDENDRKPYVALVRKLADSGSRRDRETAFFLIRHSELTYRKEGVVVNKAFRLPLEKIFLDTRLDWIVRDQYEMFELNFDPYHLQRLQERRREILAAHQGGKQHF